MCCEMTHKCILLSLAVILCFGSVRSVEEIYDPEDAFASISEESEDDSVFHRKIETDGVRELNNKINRISEALGLQSSEEQDDVDDNDSESLERGRGGPPEHTKWAQMARYIVHKSEWLSLGTISSLPQLTGFPFVNIISTADGPRNGASTGVPYFYMTTLDFSTKDIIKDNRVTVMMTLDQDLYCKRHNLDPMDPRCARIMLSGKIVKLLNGTKEYYFAKRALFMRHPIMRTWPKDHSFFFAKLKIARVAVLDWFGGAKYVDLREYYNTPPETKTPIAFSPYMIHKMPLDV